MKNNLLQSLTFLYIYFVSVHNKLLKIKAFGVKMAAYQDVLGLIIERLVHNTVELKT